MLNLKDKQILLACGATNMRKQIDGLAVIVQSSFGIDPCSPSVFVFCNKSRNRLKMLEWDGNGFWLHLKRLEQGRLKWPDTNGDKTMTLTNEELYHLLGSPGLAQKLKRKEAFDHLTL